MKYNQLTNLGEVPGVGDLPKWVGFCPPSIHVKVALDSVSTVAVI